MKIVSAGKLSFVFGGLLAISLAAHAEGNSISVSPSATSIKYSGSNVRDKAHEYGIDLDGTIGDAGIRTVYGRSVVSYKLGIPVLHQDHYFLRGSYKFTNVASGTVTTGLNYTYVANDDSTHNTDGVKAYQPTVSYISNDGALYLDLGYAETKYGGIGSLKVTQWTPTIGTSLNDGYDWVQARAFLIHVAASSPLTLASRAQNKSNTSAIDLSWTHYLQDKPWGLASVGLNVLVGERIYAVNGDGGSLSNLADIHKGSVSLSANWSLPGDWNLSTMVSEQKFQEAVSHRYTMRFGYVGLSKKF